MALRLCYTVDDHAFCVPIPVLRLKRWWRWPLRRAEEPPPDPWFEARAFEPQLLNELAALSTIAAASEALSREPRAHIEAAVAKALEQLSLPRGFSITGLEREP